MKMRLETKRIVVDGTRFRRIVTIQALDVSDLPSEYTNGHPWAGWDQGIFKVVSATHQFRLLEGAAIPESLFQKILGLVQESGCRLHEINTRINALRATWNGTEDIEF